VRSSLFRKATLSSGPSRKPPALPPTVSLAIGNNRATNLLRAKLTASARACAPSSPLRVDAHTARLVYTHRHSAEIRPGRRLLGRPERERGPTRMRRCHRGSSPLPSRAGSGRDDGTSNAMLELGRSSQAHEWYRRGRTWRREGCRRLAAMFEAQAVPVTAAEWRQRAAALAQAHLAHNQATKRKAGNGTAEVPYSNTRQQ
jgi:hypothetical protein